MAGAKVVAVLPPGESTGFCLWWQEGSSQKAPEGGATGEFRSLRWGRRTEKDILSRGTGTEAER